MANELYEHYTTDDYAEYKVFRKDGIEPVELTWKLQTFKTGFTGDNESFRLYQVRFKLKREADTTFSDIYVTINKVGYPNSHNFHYPIYPEYAKSDNVSQDNVPTAAYEWVTFNFNGNIIHKGVEYCMVLSVKGDDAYWINIQGVWDAVTRAYNGGSASNTSYGYDIEDFENPDNWEIFDNKWTFLFKVYGVKIPIETTPPPPTPPLPDDDIPITVIGRNADNYITEVFCIESDLFRFFGEHIDNINDAKDKFIKGVKRCFTYEN